MSKLAQSSGDDHPEAAGKHLSDASELYVHHRFDGAAYLAGYVIECCLKSVHLFEGKALPKHHRINDLGQGALRFATMPSARTARYCAGIAVTHPVYDPATGWKETLRYRAAGLIPDGKSAQWIEEAEHVYKQTIVKMKLDGVL